ncbi:hypothetical protein OMA_06039, partial [Enterococcus faecium EnGen0045]
SFSIILPYLIVDLKLCNRTPYNSLDGTILSVAQMTFLVV